MRLFTKFKNHFLEANKSVLVSESTSTFLFNFFVKSKFNLFFLIFSFFSGIPLAFSQFYGWPSGGSEMDGTTLTVNSLQYADLNRVRVNGANYLGSNLYELDIEAPVTVTDISTMDFPTGKWGLIIQMEDPNSTNTTGQNTRIEIQTFTQNSSTTGTLIVELPTGVSWPSFNFSSNCRVQLIRVMVYDNLELEQGGQLTCHPYNHDDGTGGVVVFVANNTTYFRGGFINASGKGYANGDGYTLGIGGSGTPANMGTPGGGDPAGIFPYARIPLLNGSMPPQNFNLDKTNNGVWCSDHPWADPINDIDESGNILIPGEDGYGATNNGVVGTSTTSVTTYHPTFPAFSSPWDTLIMGKSGTPGVQAGTGGGAGGHGGTGGGNSVSPILGQMGQPGLPGGKGGDVADGVRGGGIILLKTRNIDKTQVHNAFPFLLANGENGIGGQNGQKGGDGGLGGLGVDGNCDGSGTIVPPGEIGGRGESGIGAGGGDGSDGGSSGTIWVMKRTTVSVRPNAQWWAGLPGPAGMGGYSLKQRKLPLPLNYNEGFGYTTLPNLTCNNHNYYHCPTDCEELELCDCDTVFEYLANEMSNFTIGNNTYIPYYLENGSKRLYYDPAYVDKKGNDPEKTLYFIGSVHGCLNTFRCVMRDQELFDSLVRKMFGLVDLMTFTPDPLSTPLDLGINTALMPSSNIVDMRFSGFGGNHHVMEYNKSLNRLMDMDDPSNPAVYDGHCALKEEVYYEYFNPDTLDYTREGVPLRIDYIYYEKTGPDGNNGTTGDFYDENFYEDDFAPMIVPDDNNRIKYNEYTDFADVKSFHGAESMSIKVDLDPEMTKSSEYILYDIQGRLISKGTINGSYTITNLRKSVYFLHLNSGNMYDVKKIGF